MENEKIYPYKGEVRMFNEEKGFGFIRSGSRADIFFHVSQVDVRNVTLRKGDKVLFEKIVTDTKGSHAEGIHLIADEESK